MTDFMYLRALSESSNNDDVLEILGRSTVDATILVIKAAVVFGKELAAIKLERDNQKKAELINKAIIDAKKMRAAANKIPSDGIADHVWRLFTKPWWSSMYEYDKAASNDDMSNMVKNDTLKKFDSIILYLEKQKSKLEEKTNGI